MAEPAPEAAEPPPGDVGEAEPEVADVADREPEVGEVEEIVPLCAPLAVRCAGERERERCAADGMAWEPHVTCPMTDACVEGECLSLCSLSSEVRQHDTLGCDYLVADLAPGRAGGGRRVGRAAR